VDVPAGQCGHLRNITPAQLCSIAPEQTAIRCALQTCDPSGAQPRQSLPASAFRLIARSRRFVVSRIVVHVCDRENDRHSKAIAQRNSRHRGVVSAISERGATSRRRKNAVAARNFKAPKGLFSFGHAHRKQEGCKRLGKGGESGSPLHKHENPKRQSRRGSHRGGFALSPIRAAFSDGVRRVGETGSEVSAANFTFVPARAAFPACAEGRPSPTNGLSTEAIWGLA